MAQYKDGNYIVKDGEIFEVQIDIPRMMGAEVIHVALKDFKKQTNADRLRMMSDEELADFITARHYTPHCPVPWCEESAENCEECWLNWLRKEAEDG